MPHPNEELIHAINDTDLIPALVPEIVSILKKALGGWYHVYGNTATGQMLIHVDREKYEPGRNGGMQIATVDLDTHKATLTCYGVGNKGVKLELESPDCWQELEAWCKRLQEKKNPWR